MKEKSREHSVRLFRCNHVLYGLLIPLVAALVMKGANPATEVYADNKKLNIGDHGQKEIIYILADKLVTDHNTKSAEFIGNVKATQGATVITADRLKIYHNGSEKGDRPLAGQEAIQKIIATGSVRIQIGDILAETQRAVYSKETRTIVLTGANSRVGDGKNAITGSTITLYMDEKSIKVSSGKNNRVKAVFGPLDK